MIVTGANTAYRPWLPSPLLGEPEWVIEKYVFEKMIESGHYTWIHRQYRLNPTDRPDIVARSEHDQYGPNWTVVEVKASPLRDKHFRQLERYVEHLSDLVGWRRVIGVLIAPDIPLHQPAFGRGRVFYAPPEWIALHRTLEAIDARDEELA